MMKADLTPYWKEIPEYKRLKKALDELNALSKTFAMFDITKGWGEGLRTTSEEWDNYLDLDTTIEPHKYMTSKETSAAPSRWIKQARKIEKFLRHFERK